MNVYDVTCAKVVTVEGESTTVTHERRIRAKSRREAAIIGGRIFRTPRDQVDVEFVEKSRRDRTEIYLDRLLGDPAWFKGLRGGAA